jgi:hypothetical protein
MLASQPPVKGKVSIKDMIKNVANQVNQGGSLPSPVPGNNQLAIYKKEAEKLKKLIHENG